MITVIAAAFGCDGGFGSDAAVFPSIPPTLSSVAGYRVHQPGAFVDAFTVAAYTLGSGIVIEQGWDPA